VWTDAAEKLAGIGRVIADDRRGCARSERPEPYERTSVAEQADDVAALLDALGATPALVIGRSYGGTIAIDLALRHPDCVRAVVGLQPDGSREMAPAAAAWVDAFAERMRAVAAGDGVHTLGEGLITDLGGHDAWRSLPDEVRGALAENGPAILAELAGEWWLPADTRSYALGCFRRLSWLGVEQLCFRTSKQAPASVRPKCPQRTTFARLGCDRPGSRFAGERRCRGPATHRDRASSRAGVCRAPGETLAYVLGGRGLA
jgi:pimeloyl-ACP methyl ester carboxylesterase